MNSQKKKNYFSELEETDWDFARENGGGGMASYHWYPARFIPQLPGILINYFSTPGERILDPFCGCGTTLVEAYKFGRKATGIDINPIAAMISRSKLVPFEQRNFSDYLDNLLKIINPLLLDPKLSVPNYEENRSWYHPNTLRELASLWIAINQLENDKGYKTIAYTAFSAILKASCSQNEHWGWVCDNCKPEKLLYKNAIKKFSYKMNQYRMAALSLNKEVADLQEKHINLTKNNFNVYQGNCASILESKRKGLYDLVVTSPPYSGTVDYIKAQRLSFLWFDSPKDEFRKNEIGARYKRGRKNFIEEYLNDMKNAFVEIRRTLRKGGYCCVIIGESPNRKPTTVAFESLLEDIGFEHDRSLERKVAVQRRLFPIIQHEKIIIVRNK